jgi:hypothetical protein
LPIFRRRRNSLEYLQKNAKFPENFAKRFLRVVLTWKRAERLGEIKKFEGWVVESREPSNPINKKLFFKEQNKNMASADYYLKIDTIEGESDATGLKNNADRIVVIRREQQRIERSGYGSRRRKVSLQDFHFVVQNGKASPQLFLACAKATTFRKRSELPQNGR